MIKKFDTEKLKAAIRAVAHAQCKGCPFVSECADPENQLMSCPDIIIRFSEVADHIVDANKKEAADADD